MTYWLKVAGDASFTIPSEWQADRANWERQYGPVSGFPRRPRIESGDMLIHYAAGSPAIYGVGKIFAVDVVTSDPYPGEHKRWPWVVDTHLEVAGPRLEFCPSLDEIGVSTKSVRRHSHIRLTPEQGEKAASLIAVAAQRPD